MRLNALVLFLLSTGVATAQGPKTIAAVRTWGDLQDQPLITLKDGTKVRVGLEARECPRNSHFLMYALVEGLTWQRLNHVGERELGPLDFLYRLDGEAFAPEATPLAENRKWREEGAKQLLFITSIPIGRAQKCELEVFDQVGVEIGKGIGKATVTTSSKTLDHWFGFVRPLNRAKSDPNRVLSLNDIAFAAPICDGELPVMANFAGAKAIPRTQELPRLAFAIPDPRVKIEVDATILRISSKLKVDRQPSGWLCRLWVNDQPYLPKIGKEVRHPDFSDDEQMAEESFSIRWNIDPKLIGAKSGDRIGVQMLFVWDGWDSFIDSGTGLANSGGRPRDGEDERGIIPRWPILTNKAEFVAP